MSSVKYIVLLVAVMLVFSASGARTLRSRLRLEDLIRGDDKEKTEKNSDRSEFHKVRIVCDASDEGCDYDDDEEHSRGMTISVTCTPDDGEDCEEPRDTSSERFNAVVMDCNPADDDDCEDSQSMHLECDSEDENCAEALDNAGDAHQAAINTASSAVDRAEKVGQLHEKVMKYASDAVGHAGSAVSNAREAHNMHMDAVDRAAKAVGQAEAAGKAHQDVMDECMEEPCDEPLAGFSVHVIRQ